ncbi:MAG: YaiO family outer membrane beta-barrel protein, partial [Deltaproteobacteria bacterium]
MGGDAEAGVYDGSGGCEVMSAIEGRPGRGKAARVAVVAFVIGALLFVPAAGAQERVDVDAMFKHARELAFSGDHATARAVAREILRNEPDYVEVSVFLARLDAWDGDYDGAARQLEAVLARHPDSVEARLALVDVDIWRGRLEAAARGCDAILEVDPGNPEALKRRKQIAGLMAQEPPAPAAAQRGALPGTRRGYRAGVEYQVEDFDRDFGAWHQAVASLEKRADWGTVIGRVNYFSRFGDNAAQFDVEVYRDIDSKTYANVAATAATDSVLPDYSVLLELYRALPRGLEGSAGIR